jgi:hypothetical protein
MPESEIDRLLSEYERFVRLPWQADLSGQERTWFIVYDPRQERRLRLRLTNFELATKNAGHGWIHVDLTGAFATWMAGHEYREAYFEQPDAVDLDLENFRAHVTGVVAGALASAGADEHAVVAVTGLASLFGLARASAVLDHAASSIRGRLLAFFPGKREGDNYRLLDAQDGRTYLAVPITVHGER